jgi:hypothetical protein
MHRHTYSNSIKAHLVLREEAEHSSVLGADVSKTVCRDPGVCKHVCVCMSARVHVCLGAYISGKQNNFIQ